MTDFIIDDDKFFSLKANLSNALQEAILQVTDLSKTATVTAKVQLNGKAPNENIYNLDIIEYDIKVRTTQDIMSAKQVIEPCQARVVGDQLMFCGPYGQMSMDELGAEYDD